MPVVTTRGKGFEDELVKQIEDVTGLPATTSIRSAIRALAHLGVSQRRDSDALSQ
jgi:maleate cis-trans isomerase